MCFTGSLNPTEQEIMFCSSPIHYILFIYFTICIYIYIYCVSVSDTSMRFALNFLMKSNEIPKILLNTFPSHPRRVRGSPPKPREENGVCDQRRWRVTGLLDGFDGLKTRNMGCFLRDFTKRCGVNQQRYPLVI